MISVGQFDFLPERMIFLPHSLKGTAREECFSRYPSLDDEEANRVSLFANRPDQSNFYPEKICRIGFSLSENCNLRCLYCSSCSVEGAGKSISTEDVLCFVSDIMKKWTVGSILRKNHPKSLEIYFTGGGEPTYDWDSFKSIVIGIEEKAKKNEIPISLGITTNGIYDEERCSFLATHFNRIMVSYDGLPEIQNRNRISPHVGCTSIIAERTIRFLSRNSNNLTIRTTVWYEDFSRLKEMADYLFETFGISFAWSILPVSPMGRALKRLSSNKYSDEKYDFLKWYLDLQAYCLEKWPGSKVDSQFFSTTPAHVFCGSMAYSTSIVWLLANGNLVTCIESNDHPTVVGRVFNGGVQYQHICNDPLLAKAQEMFIKCRNCYAFPFCKGGCPAKALTWEKSGSKEKPWECDQTVRFWKHLLEAISKGQNCFGWRLCPSRYPELAKVGVLECIQPEHKSESMQK